MMLKVRHRTEYNDLQIRIRNLQSSGKPRKLIVDATHFYASELLSKRMINKLSIKIEFDTTLNYAGLCTWVDDYIRPKEFLIELNPCHPEDCLLSLAHEMVHIKQYVKGELRELVSGKDLISWKGTRYRHTNDAEWYDEQPWEIEAYTLEGLLYKKFLGI